MNVNRQGGIGRGALALRLAMLIAFSPALLHAASPIDRTRLPIADPKPKKVYQPLPADVPLPKPFRVTPPKDAPNILIILLDDIGFGAPSPFGGSIQMPTLQRLADDGLRYNRFHTIALCAPTRAALKAGRNHHRLNMGSIPEIATGYAGNTTVVPNYAQPLAEILRLNGYSTAAVGKWHETPGRETTAAGPQDRWPTRQGFEKFYGFIGAEENMYEPTVHDGVTAVDVSERDDYHFIEDMTDEAIAWLRQQHSLKPEKPFFMYYASPGAHAPHHAPKKWIEKYKGRFDKGWDKLREETLENMIKAGVVPEDTQLAKKPDSVPDWDDLSDEQKKVFARQAEVFAAYCEYSDYEVGRLIDAIAGMGELDNTLIFYISGDNGTSAEGDQTGNWNWNKYLNGVPETLDEQLAHLDAWGDETTYPHMSVGWAIAFDTPFAFTKQVAGDFGGTRNGTVVHWPAGIQAKGEIRNQFSHVVDVVPTVLEATGIPAPTEVHGVEQIPMQGTSMVYSFDHADAPERHRVQYFEVVGNRGIYEDGWLARCTVKLPWESKAMHSIASDDGWELYDTRHDFSLTNNLAGKYPERLKAMKELFMQQAIENQVLPLDDRLLERLLPEVAGRPTMMGDRTRLELFPGTIGLVEDAILNVKNTSSTITSVIRVPDKKPTNGIIFAQGGRFGGWALYVEDSKPAFAYNYVGDVFDIKSDRPLPAGESTIACNVDYDGGGKGKGATVRLMVNDQVVAEGKLDATVASRFAVDEGSDVGMDRGSPVLKRAIGTLRYDAFDGKIERVILEVQPEKDP